MRTSAAPTFFPVFRGYTDGKGLTTREYRECYQTLSVVVYDMDGLVSFLFLLRNQS